MQQTSSHVFSNISGNEPITNPHEHKENMVEISGRSIQKGAGLLHSGKQFQNATNTTTSNMPTNNEIKRKPLGDLSNTKKSEKTIPLGKINKRPTSGDVTLKKNQGTTKPALTIKVQKTKGINKSQSQVAKKPPLKKSSKKQTTITNIPDEIDYMPPSAVDIPVKEEPHLFTNLDFAKLLGKPYIPPVALNSKTSLEIPKKLEFEKIPGFDDVLVEDWKPENTLNLLSEFDIDIIEFDINDLMSLIS